LGADVIGVTVGVFISGPDIVHSGLGRQVSSAFGTSYVVICLAQ
jgi:hypothetical protein